MPRRVLADEVLVGSLDIPEQFPMLIERYLAAGGVDWPDIHGLAAAIAQAEAAQPTATELAAMPTFSISRSQIADLTTSSGPAII